MAACLSLIGLAHAQDKAIDCKDQGKFNLCNINEKVGLKSSAPVGNVQVEVKTPSPVGPGQVAGAQVQQPVSENKSNTAKIIEAVKAAPVPQPDVVKDEYTDGKTEWKILSCVEMSPIRYWAKNPGNEPNKEIRNDYGTLRGRTDAYGWFETQFSYYDKENKVLVTGFGGALGWRQPVYKNGVFNNWSGWPVASPAEMDRAGWGWNLATIGFCEGKMNGTINNSPDFK